MRDQGMTVAGETVYGPPKLIMGVRGYGGLHVGPEDGCGRRIVSRTVRLQERHFPRTLHDHDAEVPALSRFINGECGNMGSVGRAVMGIIGPLAGNDISGSGAAARIAAVHAMDSLDDAIASSLCGNVAKSKRADRLRDPSKGPRGFVAALVAVMDQDPGIADTVCEAVGAAVRASGSIDDADGRALYGRWVLFHLFAPVLSRANPGMALFGRPDGTLETGWEERPPAAGPFRSSMVMGENPKIAWSIIPDVRDEDVIGLFDPGVALTLRPLEEDEGSPVSFPCVAWATRPEGDGERAARRIAGMSADAARIVWSRTVQDGIRARTAIWDSEELDRRRKDPLSPTGGIPLTWKALSCLAGGMMPDPIMDAGTAMFPPWKAMYEAMDTAARWTEDHRADPGRVLDLARAIGDPYDMDMSFVDDIRYGITFIYGNSRHGDHGVNLAVDVIDRASRHHDQEWVRALLSAWLLASALHDVDDMLRNPEALVLHDEFPSITAEDLAGAVKDLGDGIPGRFIAECLTAEKLESSGKAHTRIFISDGMWDGRGFSIDIIGLDPRVRSTG